MKPITLLSAAFLLAILGLSVPVPILTSEAAASRMDGRGSACSTGVNCMQDRYHAAMRKAKKTNKSR